MIDEGTGYLQITEFSEHTGEQFDAAVNGLIKQGIDSLIIDLRNNPGGLLEAAVDVAEPIAVDVAEAWLAELSDQIAVPASAVPITPAYASPPYSIDTQIVPTRPSSSPMIAKMKSVVEFGTQPHFSLLAPSPTPNQPPEPSAYLPCRAW